MAAGILACHCVSDRTSRRLVGRLVAGFDGEFVRIQKYPRGHWSARRTGAYRLGVLQLQIQPVRIDWILLPKDDPESELFQDLGDFEESSVAFCRLISQWLERAPTINRIAFGTQLYFPTSSQPESLQIVAQILTYVTINWAGTRDFVFQLNRPRQCATLPQLGEINRLVKWQNIVRKKMTATLTPEPTSSVTTTAEQHAAFWELDISSPVPTESKAPLPPQQLPQLLAELRNSASEIVAKGDVQ
jgi:hypothetical protein